ncbi:YdeI/OmpD-associated family protein [Montanilutibacter psychrotolerans]|uniref:YdhG-like domain-containing protein n=1 Tax=Montanilutibacter psychrotolerans TaxID=1327343 RepID=A0A3M8T0S1_9GAMM|nr:YdeI/OmpD-associated family protein [Lysobacter psychrotolerans]RNF85266.1 hypothetical protein EER27_05735 [Lysobacter psychrotolerans]
MGQPDPRIDAYIGTSGEFARPILAHLRTLVHASCPQAEETLKWGMPSFTYRGRILCSMAAFKQHATFGFWQGALIVDADGNQADEAMGQFGRLAKVSDLPGKRVMAGYIKQAMALIDTGVKTPKTRGTTPRPPPVVPEDLAAALAANPPAAKAFAGFAPGQQREYVDWITEAKREQTRQQRLSQAVEWIAQGKLRHWKYMGC